MFDRITVTKFAEEISKAVEIEEKRINQKLYIMTLGLSSKQQFIITANTNPDPSDWIKGKIVEIKVDAYNNMTWVR